MNKSRTSSEDFGPPSEIFGSFWVNFVNLWKTSDHLRKSSEDFGLTSEIFGCLVINFYVFGRLRVYFGKLRVFASGESTIWDYLVLCRVQVAINCTALVQSESSNFVEWTNTQCESVTRSQGRAATVWVSVISLWVFRLILSDCLISLASLLSKAMFVSRGTG